MSVENCLLDPLGCLSSAAGSGASDAATSAWDSVCKSFADAAAELLKAFGQAFAALPTLNLESAGISSTYGISLSVGAIVAALLVFAGVIRTAWTHDGSGIAQAVTGVGKAILAWMLTAAVATAALEASDEITRLVVSQSFGSQQALANRLATIVNWAEVTGDPGQAVLGGSLLLVFALIGIVLVIVLWFELLLRNAAIAVLVATSPIAAAGQASEATKAWWLRTGSATAQLIILKPVIALVFAVGFGMAGTSDGVESLLEGLLVLALAAFSWPVIARFFTFGSVQASSSGLSTVLGFLAGQASQSGGRGPAGVSPDQWSMAAENRTMAGQGESQPAWAAVHHLARCPGPVPLRARAEEEQGPAAGARAPRPWRESASRCRRRTRPGPRCQGGWSRPPRTAECRAPTRTPPSPGASAPRQAAALRARPAANSRPPRRPRRSRTRHPPGAAGTRFPPTSAQLARRAAGRISPPPGWGDYGEEGE